MKFDTNWIKLITNDLQIVYKSCKNQFYWYELIVSNFTINCNYKQIKYKLNTINWKWFTNEVKQH